MEIRKMMWFMASTFVAASLLMTMGEELDIASPANPFSAAVVISMALLYSGCRWQRQRSRRRRLRAGLASILDFRQ